MALNINKHRLFKMAHAMIRKSEAINLSDALRQAWKVMKLQAQLLVSKVHFTFRKVSGEIREAYGTLCDIDYTPKTPANGKPRQRPDDIICYFDLDKQAFRSFNAANLI